jgi:hypothetical protein
MGLPAMKRPPMRPLVSRYRLTCSHKIALASSCMPSSCAPICWRQSAQSSPMRQLRTEASVTRWVRSPPFELWPGLLSGGGSAFESSTLGRSWVGP